ncbi:hypothetical protein GGS23DRAFT_592120 [Durotheca rogersii]|uniref:uncharacterized protein n=1 Tax=Durotheca rogersii TaxID=419775 RepID=UPI002220ACB6|nr:uncharacterized protein GGS23DRAFT_592120 [Durotheca rogersii]KAI5868341.1 hypothetical protein GGS23DRAFT_592120 [Durotheca rogersii]
MSRKPAKPRASAGKTFIGSGSSSFGAFSTSSGTDLSYLAEPPDFSPISDSNVIVSLKNLQKKDATTKAKALEELVAYAQAHPHERDGGAEEPVLEAWVQLYPRISIDNSRRVRELSHVLQFEFMKSARKRMEKHVPKIVGSWLAGTFDRDRVVARVATEGLSSFLTTSEKVTHFWRRCQQQILDYASDAMKETTETLSDKRSTSADDAEAKYYRVLGSSLALVLNLLQKLDPSDIQKCLDSYDQFFEQDKVWASATISDAAVRRLACQLLSTCLEKRSDRVEADLLRLGKTFVAEGLKCSQAGSAADYISTLTELTARHPTVWTSDYRGKKTPTSRLKGFLEKGSQGTTSQFWHSLDRMLEIIPSGILPEDLSGALEFLESMRLGLTSRDEPHSNAVDGWSTYLNTTKRFLKTMQSGEDRGRIVQDNIFPLITHYLYPTPETSAWASGSHVPILIKAYTSTAMSPFADVVQMTSVVWNKWKEEFKTRMRNSLPEASREHERSQKSVADEGYRWFTLTGIISDAHERTLNTDRPIPNMPAKDSLELLHEALELLETRNWKPFGAAATVESAFKQSPGLFRHPSNDTNKVFEFLAALLSRGKTEFLQSNAGPYIFSSINLLGGIPERQQEYETIWKENITNILEHIESPAALPALTTLISTEHASPLAHRIPALQGELVKLCLVCAVDTTELGSDFFNAVIAFDTLTDVASKRLVRELGNRVTNSLGQPNEGVVRSLRLIAEKNPGLLVKDEEVHMSLMASLLSLSERFHDIYDAATLRALMEGPPTTGNSRLLGLVHQGISNADPGSLSVDTLVQQAMQVYGSLNPSDTDTDQTEQLRYLIPDVDVWEREINLLLQDTPNPSLSIASVLGGAYFLPTLSPNTSTISVQRDRSGCSIPGRMALYISKLLSAGFQLRILPISKRVEILRYLSLTAELTADQLTVMSGNKIWTSLSSEVALSDAEGLISSSRTIIINMAGGASGWREGTDSDESQVIHRVVNAFIHEAKSLTPQGLYYARALSELLRVLAETHGFPSSGEQWLKDLDILKSGSSTVLPAVAILGGLGETISVSRVISNFCNRLVSDISGASFGKEKDLITLVLLNACMQIYEAGELPAANNRLVFAARQLTSWMETPEDLDYRFAAETCRCLQCLLPCIKDVYGSYWENTIDFCTYLWAKPAVQPLDLRLPEIHASLRLINALQSIEDPNDDLIDSLKSSAEKRSTALIELLKLPRGNETQPLEIVDSIICRQVENIPIEHVRDLSELYGLVASDSRAIQTAAFTILHKSLPAVQEKLAVDVLLDKKDARLPDELLSLLLDAPKLEDYSDEALARFPKAIRAYLLSWLLVFDSLKAASFKIRSDYAECLKAGSYIGPLMEFIFDVLGHSVSHPLNLAKANFTDGHIQKYDLKLADAESDERNMQWLLIHIFYLVLKYVPTLFKTWYLECRFKQTKIAVSSWMTKYFSPIIVLEALDDVEKWNAAREAPTGDEKELVVRVSRPAREVTASYEVDDLDAMIAIRIPHEYPLESPTVLGVNRVAVNEKRWQSWIMTTQGVITFSGGSIIDGLTTFRRNIVGAMKGQTECAICYSIISTDRKMPDKRCQTCKNLFHRTCLYKWFQSSNQNTCPLCRNPIDYLGADVRARRAV